MYNYRRERVQRAHEKEAGIRKQEFRTRTAARVADRSTQMGDDRTEAGVDLLEIWRWT